jgi:hypothetical protein
MLQVFLFTFEDCYDCIEGDRESWSRVAEVAQIAVEPPQPLLVVVVLWNNHSFHVSSRQV